MSGSADPSMHLFLELLMLQIAAVKVYGSIQSEKCKKVLKIKRIPRAQRAGKNAPHFPVEMWGNGGKYVRFFGDFQPASDAAWLPPPSEGVFPATLIKRGENRHSR